MLKIEEDPAGSGPRPGRFPGSSHAPERPGGMYFLFRGLRPGSTWRILAKTNLATSWVVLESGVEAPARNLKLVFDPGGFAWGQVAVPSGGSRPPLVRVLFGRVDADASREGSSTSLFGEGHFRIEGLSPGEWEFRAEAQGMASAPVRATIPTVGGGINVGTLSLVSTGVPAASKPGRLQVEAWSATGIPLAGRDVTATREDGSPPPEPLPRRTLRDGRWRATLAAGQYHIVIHNRDGSSAVEGDIDVVVDVETSLILRASK